MNAAERRQQEIRREEAYMQRLLRRHTAPKCPALQGIVLAIELGTCGWLIILGILWLLVGCGAQGGDAPSPHTQGAPMLQTDVPGVQVNVTIVTHTSGAGNDLWSDAYIDRLLAEATRLVHGVVVFSRGHTRIEADDSVYAMNQGQLLQHYGQHPVPHAINVIISRPDTEDSAGRSRPWYAHEPLFVMRARSGDTITDTALIYLHELGHNLGLAHESNPFYQDGLTTDNYWMEDAGRQLLSIYVDDITHN